MVIDGVQTSVIYLDTEGFESIGKSNVYDDRLLLDPSPANFIRCFESSLFDFPDLSFVFFRIFALATVLSSVLIYNLPETVCFIFELLTYIF